MTKIHNHREIVTKEQLKIGIALSGGGVRAAVFHLGVLGRLAIEKLLENITFKSTVSGGTLVTGLIYSIAGNKWPNSDFFLNECLPKAKYYLTNKNIQRNALFRLIFQPWYLLQGRAKLISESLQFCWQISANLNDIPWEPRWVINATTYESGKNWRFIPQRRMGDYVVNYVESPIIPLADAMAASAAYPGLIGPLILRTKNYKWFKYEGNAKKTIQPIFKKLHLWDGAIYDNLGIESLFKIRGSKYRESFNFLIVSDASRSVDLEKPSYKRAFRLVNITMDQIRGLRARNLVNHFEENKNSGVYLKIGNSGYKILKDAGVSDNIINDLIKESLSVPQIQLAANLETTLRRLSIDEFNVLFQHG